MNREQHLQWAKDRALEYVRRGELTNAYSSLRSDLSKHEELANHPGIGLGDRLFVGGHLRSEGQMRHWIEGFN